MKAIEAARSAVRSVIKLFAAFLNKVSGGKLTPNFITLTSLLAHVPIAALIAYGQNKTAAVLLIIFGLFDALDGELARLTHKASAAGMFIDSVTDRVKEIVLYVGITLAVLSSNPSKTSVVVLVAALGTSVLISYLNAWGEVVITNHAKSRDHKINKTFRSGLLGFDLRMALIVAGLLADKLLLAVYVILILGVLTVLQRFFDTIGRLKNV